MSAFRRARIACPECGRGPRDDTAAVKIDGRGACWYCHRCSSTGSVRPDEVDELLRGAAVSTAVVGDWQRAQNAFVDASEITADCPAGKYLLARGCALPPPRSHLRWVPRARHPSGYVGPALIALLSDPLANAFVTIHRTWIREDGSKAEVDPPRLYWPGLPKAGGVCRLWPDDGVHLGLGVAEGIETALTLARGFVGPVWACMDAGNLAAFPYIYPLESITIAVDHDRAGIDAVLALGRRWEAEAERRLGYLTDDCVTVVFPNAPGADVNDTGAFTVPGAPDPAWEAAVQEECRHLGLSPWGSSARVEELP